MPCRAVARKEPFVHGSMKAQEGNQHIVCLTPQVKAGLLGQVGTFGYEGPLRSAEGTPHKTLRAGRGGSL